MKWSEAYEHAGQTIAVPVKLIHAIGAKGAILVAQLFYWKGRERSAEGWVYKTKEELRKETGISLKEQRKCVDELKKMGVLETKYDRLEHRLNYRLHVEMLDEIMDADSPGHVPKRQMLPAHAQKADGTGPKGRSPSVQTADRHIDQRLLPQTTTENTTTISGSRSLGLNGHSADHGVVVASFFVSEEDEPADVLDKLSEKFQLSNPQRRLVADYFDHEGGLSYVLQKARLVLDKPRVANLGGAFMTAIRDDWKSPRPSERPKRKKVAIQEPPKERSDEERSQGLEAIAKIKSALRPAR